MKKLLFFLIFFSFGCDVAIDTTKQSGDNSFTQSQDTTSTTTNNISGVNEVSSCAQIRTSDGSEGFLWKPISDSDSKLVVLLPSFIDDTQLDSVCVFVLATSEKHCGIYSGRTNGDRPTYRFPLSGINYKSPLIVKELSGVVCEIEILSPGERQD